MRRRSMDAKRGSVKKENAGVPWFRLGLHERIVRKKPRLPNQYCTTGIKRPREATKASATEQTRQEFKRALRKKKKKKKKKKSRNQLRGKPTEMQRTQIINRSKNAPATERGGSSQKIGASRKRNAEHVMGHKKGGTSDGCRKWLRGRTTRVIAATAMSSRSLGGRMSCGLRPDEEGEREGTEEGGRMIVYGNGR